MTTATTVEREVRKVDMAWQDLSKDGEKRGAALLTLARGLSNPIVDQKIKTHLEKELSEGNYNTVKQVLDLARKYTSKD